ncbi:hypothetical protein AJ79_00951 [Helicocarpus griseus UAMH5409]|uniref:Uncharacterized protein n=1 Tax=Helicocarpus griseus UAMH5409 TaxID=1447875 RepID=A0A2B7Y9C3_9EURO|nr:hypothetical protein AJ79_00951 [Helicocarpus griseus UAMH5409]
MATTPPPRAIRTPPTPRHGAGFDSYVPYSTRQSARLAKRQVSRGSPSFSTPNSPRSPVDAGSAIDRDSDQPFSNDQDSLSPFQSAQASPARRSDRRAKGARPDIQAHSLFDNTRGQTHLAPQTTLDESHCLSTVNPEHTSLTANMLPTPAKTPRKKAVPDSGSIARTLFKNNAPPKDPEMPTPKRHKGKKLKGFSLESFNAELETGPKDEIMIFTDSRDRIPEVHETPDNPFLSRSNEAEVAGGSQRVQRDKRVQEALHRDDGMLYVFRGKKTFRKFSSDTEEDDETDRGLLASRPDLVDDPSVPRVRPLTRSSIKPRLLFPNASQRGTAQSSKSSGSEKAINPEKTRDEDDADLQKSPSDLSAPSNNNNAPMTPPSKTTVPTPSTPLTGGRSLRSHTKEGQDDSATPTRPSNGDAVRVSPFDRWTRTKPQASAARLRKRVGTAYSDSVEPSMKKARNK